MHVLDQLDGEAYVLADTIDLWIEVEKDAAQTDKGQSVRDQRFRSRRTHR